MMITMMMAMFTMIKMTVMMAMASFQVRIDYKGQRFVGENGKEINGILVSIFTLIISVRSSVCNHALVCAGMPVSTHTRKNATIVYIVLLSYLS